MSVFDVSVTIMMTTPVNQLWIRPILIIIYTPAYIKTTFSRGLINILEQIKYLRKIQKLRKRRTSHVIYKTMNATNQKCMCECAIEMCIHDDSMEYVNRMWKNKYQTLKI